MIRMSLAACAALLAVPSPAAEAAKPCDAPVYLLVHWDVTDAAKVATYGKALGDSGLYERFGGQHVIRSRPAAVFEGAWPDNRMSVMSRWPCAEAARSYFFSEEYQRRIKPLRANGGAVTVVVFEESTSLGAARAKAVFGQR